MKTIFFFLAVSMMVVGLYVSGRHFYEWEYWVLVLTHALYFTFLRLREFAKEEEERGAE